MRTILITTAILFIGCLHTEPKPVDIKPDVVAAVKKYWESMDALNSFTLDTIIVLRIDTLTPKTEAKFRVNTLISKVNDLQSKSKYLQQVFQLKSQKAQLHATLFGSSDALTKMSKKDADEAHLDVTRNLDIMKLYINQADSINKLVSNNQCDSTTFLGYVPLVKISAINKASGVASTDSISFRLDAKFHMLNYPDLDNKN